MGSDSRLGGNRSMSESHANDGSHVGLSAKDVDRDACGFTYRTAEIEMAFSHLRSGQKVSGRRRRSRHKEDRTESVQDRRRSGQEEVGI